MLVLNSRIYNTSGNKPYSTDERQITSLCSQLVSERHRNIIIAAANGRMPAHLLAISDLVAVSDEVIMEESLAALARQYRPQKVRMAAFQSEGSL